MARFRRWAERAGGLAVDVVSASEDSMTSPAPSRPTQRNCATLRFDTRRTRLQVELAITPAGLAAIGFLVSSILLSVVPIIRASGDVARKRGLMPDDQE